MSSAENTATEAAAGMGHNNPPVDEKWLSKTAKQLKAVGKRLAEAKDISKAASKTRADWLVFGELLAEAREVIRSKPQFNAWLKENDLESVADRNTRTDAMWFAGLSPDMLDVIPADMHHPKTIRAWYRKMLKAAVAAVDGDQDAALQHDEYADFVAAIYADDWAVYQAKWEQEQEKTPYESMPPEEAAEVIIRKLARHDNPGAVFEAVRAAVEAGALEEDGEDADETDETDDGDED